MLSSNQESSYRIRRLMEINKVSDDNNTQHPQPKKQIRKRLHTSKPYQESFLNMAEARREIVTALKFHRASMKQQHATANRQSPPPELERKSISEMYPTLVPPPLNQENLNLVLPDQTLGLNLNFKDFINLNTSVYYNPMPAASSAPSAAKEVAVVKSALQCKNLETIEIGTHKNGKKVVVDSHEDDIGCYHPFEQVMEFPTWLINANETSCFHDIFDHHFSHEYSQDPALPCMEIGEIEGIDGVEWLA
ncbi:hypothetical protein SSX86_020257 [Deinandra increscens subsp. villosa]|uniref:Uncharacterized protein n=1 Tax=Deinandra increscens subsp. villosa TaxID=3103831 RepID=A0AAP0CS33_9ASTR